MSRILRKMKGKSVCFAIVISALLAMVGSSTAYAYDYYDGENANHSTYGATNNNESPSSGGEDEEHNYILDVLSRRGYGSLSSLTSDYVKNYGSNKNTWWFAKPDGSTVGYSNDESICTDLPASWKLFLRDGVVHYWCSSCGSQNSYIVNFTEYGYYDMDGVVHKLGYSGYLYCPDCGTAESCKNNGKKVGKTTVGESVGTYRNPTMASGHYQGVYVYSNVYNSNNQHLITTDPAYLDAVGKMTRENYLKMISKYTYSGSDIADTTGVKPNTDGSSIKYIDGSNNGYYVRYQPGATFKVAGGNQEFVALPTGSAYNGYEYAIKITVPTSNNASPGFGEHAYRKYNEKINFSYWWDASHGMCIHSFKDENLHSLSYYKASPSDKGVVLGTGGWNYLNQFGKCGRDYEKGYIGVCADCGETIPVLFYASPETISSIRSIRNGVEYNYYCPYGIKNMEILDANGNRTGRYLYYCYSQIEQAVNITHDCYAKCKNQYFINFECGLPGDVVVNGPRAYSVGGYFYNVFKDGENVPYMEEGTMVPYGKNTNTVASKNTISGPIFSSRGYNFKCWSLKMGDGTYVELGANPTWKDIVDKLGATNEIFKNDKATITLRAVWTNPEREVEIRDSKADGTLLKTSMVGWGKTWNLNDEIGNSVPVKKEVSISLDYKYQDAQGNDVKENRKVNAVFDMFVAETNYGSLDVVSNIYSNTGTDSNKEIILAKYSFQSIVLPNANRQGFVLLGWYHDPDGKIFAGKGGDIFTPSSTSTVTLYAVWSPSAIDLTLTDKSGVNGSDDTVWGASHLGWNYSNAALDGTAFYKLYRKLGDADSSNAYSCFSGGANGSTQSSYGFTTVYGNDANTKNSSWTVPANGIYTIELTGAAGSSVTYGTTTIPGGKGGKETITVYLEKDEIISWNLAYGNKNDTNIEAFQGGIGKKSKNAMSTSAAGNGGAASVLKIGKNNTILAVAGGGSGASYMVDSDSSLNKSVKGTAGGGSEATGGLDENKLSNNSQTGNSNDEFQDSENLQFAKLYAGGGGGYDSPGNAGRLITARHIHGENCVPALNHTAPDGAILKSGTALSFDAKYNKSGGCYTKRETKSIPCTGTCRYTDGQPVFRCQTMGPGATNCPNNGTRQPENTHTCSSSASYYFWVCSANSSHQGYTSASGKPSNFSCTRTTNSVVYGFNPSSCSHSHKAPGTEKLFKNSYYTASAYEKDAVYKESGGCYTTMHITYEFVTIPVPQYSHGVGEKTVSIPKNTTYKWHDIYGNEHTTTLSQKKDVKITFTTSRTETSVLVLVSKINGTINPKRDELCCNPTTNPLPCTHMTIAPQILYTASCNCYDCPLSENWGEPAISGDTKIINNPATGGGNFVNTDLTKGGFPVVKSHQHSSGVETRTYGSIKVTCVLSGVTQGQTNYLDKTSDDKSAPNMPTLDEECVQTSKVLNSDNTISPSIKNVYFRTQDNGTLYSYKVEAWSALTLLRQAESNVVTTRKLSGIKEYRYCVTTSASSPDTTSDKWTGAQPDSSGTGRAKVEEILMPETLPSTSSWNKTYYLHVYAVDYAGNSSDIAKYPFTFSYKPEPEPDPDNHNPGKLTSELFIYTGENSYYDGSKYYLKADGMSSVTLFAKGSLNPTFSSVITRVAIGTAKNNSFAAVTPINSQKTTITGSFSGMHPLGNAEIEITDSATNLKQKFTMSENKELNVFAFSTAECLGYKKKGCMLSNHVLDANSSKIIICGDKVAPTVVLNGITFQGEGLNNFEFAWGTSNVFDCKVNDNGSGIKSVEIVCKNTEKKETFLFSKSSRETSATVNYNVQREDESTYEIVATDNVGNRTVVTVTTRIDRNKPVIMDNTFNITESDVDFKIDSIGNKLWNKTSVDTQWEYNWFNCDTELTYVATDYSSGIKSFNLYENGALVATGVKKGNDYTYEIKYTLKDEGSHNFVLVAEDKTGNGTVTGNQTTVNVVARLDKSAPVVLSGTFNLPRLKDLTIAEANNLANSVGSLQADWRYVWKDSENTTDSSGLASIELTILDADNKTNKKQYEMQPDYGFGDRTKQRYSLPKFPSAFVDVSGVYKERYSSMLFTRSVDTFSEFPSSSELEWIMTVKDNAGNMSVLKGTIQNYDVKAVVRATKDNGYNILSEDGKTSIPYFKTGEVGFVEVWTIGYVDKLELDFSDKQVGKVAMDCIKNGSLLPKYNLGYPSDPAYQRFVTNMTGHKVGTNPDKNGVPCATHYVYAASAVNNSIGSSKTDGWMSDGTMIRIPPNFQLAKKGQKDKHGNELYKWETCQLNVIAYKGSKSTSDEPHYVIWDESGDDLHYRITHETFGF